MPLYAWVFDGVPAANIMAQFTRRAVALMNGAWSVAEDEFLYHFTNTEALRSILDSDELWLTDYHDFADESEIRDGLAVAGATFEHLRPELSVETIRMLDALVTTPLPENAFYVACFSMLKISPHHWKEYAKDESGAALVFDPLDFETLLATDPFAVQFSRAAYTWDVKAGLFAHLAIWLEELIRFDLGRGMFDLNDYVREAAQIFMELLPMCKDVSFLREHEVRLVAAPARARSDLAARLSVHTTQGGRRYVTTAEILPGFSLPIRKILLGPQFTSDLDGLNFDRSKLERVAL